MKQARPPPSNAIAASPFFRLPPELRNCIYNDLLTTSHDIYIPDTIFKRRVVPPLQWNKPCQCTYLSPPWEFQHSMHCTNPGQISLPPNPAYIKRGLCPALLRTCKQIHAEAVGALYRKNIFYFQDAEAADRFRWRADATEAGWVGRVHIVVRPDYKGWDSFNRMYVADKYAEKSWMRYLRAERFGLGEDFPHLKSVTITLGRNAERFYSPQLKTVVGQLLDGLTWVPVVELIGVNDETLLEEWKECMERVYFDTSKEHEREERRLHMSLTEYKERPGWKNVLFWWGEKGVCEEPPCKPRPFGGDRRYRRRLYRIDTGRDITYQVGESFLPENGALSGGREEGCANGEPL